VPVAFDDAHKANSVMRPKRRNPVLHEEMPDPKLRSSSTTTPIANRSPISSAKSSTHGRRQKNTNLRTGILEHSNADSEPITNIVREIVHTWPSPEELHSEDGITFERSNGNGSGEPDS
jgi:hypothetical protein